MKRFLGSLILFFGAVGLMADQPKGTGDTYGGMMLFRNASSYNLYLEFDVDDNPFKPGTIFPQISLGKQDAVVYHYVFFVPFTDKEKFDINSADPKNYFKKISVYDLETGTLLTEINPSERDMFVLVEGSIERHTANITLTIDDSLLTGGNP
jgi:hypothetical protein